MPEMLKWDATGAKEYETGVDRGVLFVMNGSTYGEGEAWSGLTAVNESPSGAENTKLYADNQVYGILTSAEEYGGTIECYMYPDGFKKCNGEVELASGVTIGQQDRAVFGFAYRTLIGNDTEGTTHGYKIHLVYGAKVSPSEKDHQTVNDSPEAGTMSFEFTTTPVSVTGHKASATLEIDSTKVDAEELAAFEKVLYGSSEAAATLPTPEAVAAMFTKNIAG